MRKFLSGALAMGACLSLSAADLLHYPLEQDENPLKNYGSAAVDAETFMLKPSHYTPAVIGNGLRIYGMADGITIKNPAAAFPGAVTVSMYFRPERLHERMTLCSFYTADEQFLALKVQNQHLNMLDWSDPKNRRTYKCGEPLKVKEWYHVAWVMNGSRWQCYLNGKLVQEVDSKALPTVPAAKTFHIGNDFHNAVHQRDRFVGTLDEFKISGGVADGAVIAQAAEKLSAAAEFQPAPLSVTSEVVPIKTGVDNKTLSFVFNGQREPLMIYCGGGFLAMAGYSFSTVDKMAEQGITVFRTTPEGGRDFCGSTWWQGIGKYDFEIVDRNIQFAFERNPNAKLMLQVAAAPPDWWGRQFPDECTQDEQGRVKQDYFASHSYSSEKWLKDLEEAWTALFEHMKKQPYYSRIIGFTTPSGRYGECIRYGYNSQLYGKELTDYSPAELKAFRKWLKKRYGTIENMRKAYRDGKVPKSFEEVMLPTSAERKRPDSCYFADPVTDRGVLDYYAFVNDQQADAVCHFTSLMRRLCGPDKVIGLYYGYVFEDALGHNRCYASDSGHFGLGRVLREAPVNFMVGPVGYFQRNIGSVGPCMSAPASIALHGKIWLDEADIRTSLNGRKAEYSGAADLEESRAILWRTYGNTVVNRSSLWWFPIAGGKSFSHPKIWNDFGKMFRESKLTGSVQPAVDRTKSIALIMDPDSVHYRRYSHYDQVLGNLLTASRDVFAKSGVHMDSYITDDLELIPDDYPVYIFLNSFYADGKEREIIKRRFKKDGKLLVWTYGAGYFKNAEPADRLSVSPANMTDLTGIKMDWVPKLSQFESTPVAGAPLAMPAQKFKHKINPGLVVNDPAAKILAKFTNDPAMAGKGALALKEMPGWKSLYLGIPEFTPDMIRTIANYGGAHVYTDAENVVVRPGNGHILIHSGHADTVKIKLPAAAPQVVDVESGEVLARDTDNFQVEIGKNRTRLLRLF